MIKNRSVPTETVLPHIIYANVVAALAWLPVAFGFIEHYRYGNPVSGAQLSLGGAWIMIKGAPQGSAVSTQNTPALTVFVEDVEAHYQRTRAAGAKIVEDLQETCYGERQYGVEDLEGHRWLFSQHIRDVSPSDWGATIAR